MWIKNTIDNFIYPENELFKEKLDVGIAIPGGGLRACTYTLGCLRGLQNINILQSVKYISSNSGSSWTIPLFYSDNINFNKIIGEYIEPNILTIDKLDEIKDEYFTNELHNKNFWWAIIKNFIFGQNKNDFWTNTISSTFFKKYKLDGFNTLPCINSKKDWPDYKELNNSAPFNIINASCYFDKNNIVPIEFTPLYYGLPVEIKINNCLIGNNYFEPIAFGSKINKLCKSSDESFDIEIDKPKNVLSISETVSYSSNAVSQFMVGYINSSQYNLLNLPTINYFDPETVNNDYLYYNKSLKICDGVYTDNTGIIALLRRNVKTIIFCAPHNSEPQNVSKNTDVNFFNLCGLFGISTSQNNYYFNQSIRYFNKIRKVFKPEDYKLFADQIYKCTQNNEPIVFKIDLEVIENKFCGVTGGYTVRLIYIGSYINNGWLNDIEKYGQKEIVDYIKENNIYLNIPQEDITCVKYISNFFTSSNEFKYFPYIPITHLNYSKKLVNAMTSMGTYDVLKSQNNIKDWINEKE